MDQTSHTPTQVRNHSSVPAPQTPIGMRFVEELRDMDPSTIVVAEDDASMRDVLVDLLEAAGYRVVALEDGRRLENYLATSRAAEDVPYDLVISDIRMPKQSGLQVLERLRERDWSTPVVLITGFGDRATHRESARLGANVILDKPFDPEQLLEIVQRILPPQV